MEKPDLIINNYVNQIKCINDVLIFLEGNPMWLSGFVCGEGCFTGYLSLDKKSLWGIQPGLDFNITQSTNDKMLLEGINLFFNNKGDVYNKSNNVSVIAFRNVKVLKEKIIPFFSKYPLIGMKSYELERWIKLVDIYYYKRHTGKKLSSRDYMLDFAQIIKDLNIRRNNKNKLLRINIIIDWLRKLKDFPTLEDKLNLMNLIKVTLTNV
jgi:LAGLIDADG endonuclease